MNIFPIYLYKLLCNGILGFHSSKKICYLSKKKKKKKLHNHILGIEIYSLIFNFLRDEIEIYSSVIVDAGKYINSLLGNYKIIKFMLSMFEFA